MHVYSLIMYETALKIRWNLFPWCVIMMVNLNVLSCIQLTVLSEKDIVSRMNTGCTCSLLEQNFVMLYCSFIIHEK
jgi:hypothetical protein